MFVDEVIGRFHDSPVLERVGELKKVGLTTSFFQFPNTF
jgi:hypothetical protein